MPFAKIDDMRLFYRLEGRPGAPVLVLSHSIGADHGMWAPQMEGLLPHFQVLRYDTRGHGASDTPPEECSIERLGRDVIGLADSLGIGKFAFCGLSIGRCDWPMARSPCSGAPDRVGTGEYLPAIWTAQQLGNAAKASPGWRNGGDR